MNEAKKNGVRLARFLAAAGIASRRSCEELITQGRVCVNGQAVLTPAMSIDPAQDSVTFEGRKVGEEKKVYLLLHKPAGYTCSAHDVHAKKLVFDIVPDRFGRLFSVGRLDRDSEGLLLLTNDGDLAQALTHPSRQVPKQYRVSCEGSFTTGIRRQMLNGVFDGGEFLQPQAVEQCGHFRGHAELLLTLCEGKKREVRRICKAVGLQVSKLQRVAFGTVELGDLAAGSWRHLSDEEVEALRKISATALPRRHRVDSGRTPPESQDREEGASSARAQSAKVSRDPRPRRTTPPDREPEPGRDQRSGRRSPENRPDNRSDSRSGSRPDSRTSSRPDNRTSRRPGAAPGRPASGSRSRGGRSRDV